MTESQATNALGDLCERSEVKTRECLRCSAAFESEWSGERICTRCKSTTAWRNGAPLIARPSGKNG